MQLIQANEGPWADAIGVWQTVDMVYSLKLYSATDQPVDFFAAVSHHLGVQAADLVQIMVDRGLEKPADPPPGYDGWIVE